MGSVMKVVVLCPNGRRQPVKVTPNSSILEILEEACKKQGFDPTEYHLRHYNRQLDLSLSVRFANLPNNTLLELKPAEKIRNESSVTVALQLESGERVLSDFMPSTSLQDIIQKHVLPNNQSGEPVCIYMRQQFTGDQLKTTTLRNLGMIGGKTILRLIYRPLETLSSQAHVSSPLMKMPDEDHASHKNMLLKSKGHDIIKQPRLDYDNENNKDLKFEKDLQFIKKTESSGSIPITENEVFPKDSIQVTYGENFLSTKIESESDLESMDYETVNNVAEIGEIKFLGPRNAILFNLEDIAEVKKEDFPPDFFDLTIKDVQYLVADYKRIREELESEPLMLKSQREARMLQHYSCYKQAVIRVYFPDKLVLQGTFIAEETVQSVIDFVRDYLENPEKDFYLYITPPKMKLSSEKTLLEARLVPAAVVYFGSNESSNWYIHPSYRTRISDPRAAWKLAAQHRQKSEDSISLENYVGSASSRVTNSYDGNTVAPQPLEQRDTSHRSTSSDTQGVCPKWFKLGNK